MKISNLMTVVSASTPSTKKELPTLTTRTEISITKVVMVAFDGGRGYLQQYPRATWVIVGGTGEEHECSYNRFTFGSREQRQRCLTYLLQGEGTLELHVASGRGTGKPGEGRLSYDVVG